MAYTYKKTSPAISVNGGTAQGQPPARAVTKSTLQKGGLNDQLDTMQTKANAANRAQRNVTHKRGNGY